MRNSESASGQTIYININLYVIQYMRLLPSFCRILNVFNILQSAQTAYCVDNSFIFHPSSICFSPHLRLPVGVPSESHCVRSRLPLIAHVWWSPVDQSVYLKYLLLTVPMKCWQTPKGLIKSAAMIWIQEQHLSGNIDQRTTE